MNMILIVGLGNPGEKYAQTRHNLGFMVMDKLIQNAIRQPADKNQSRSCGTKFKINNKFNAEICQLTSEILLVKPLTFMNASGTAIAQIARFYRVSPENIWVVHDDVDLPLGKLKIRLGGAAAGHHGVESVIKELGTDKFVRFRLGVSHSNDIEKFVLEKFQSKEGPEAKRLIKKTVKAIQKALDQDLGKAMNEFN